jgi:hypothetical protein
MAYKIKKKRKPYYESKIVVYNELSGKRVIVKANYFKLLRTLFNRSGEKYTEAEMKKMGFAKKK